VELANANPSTVFLFDVDNTLLDNDRVAEDLKRHLIDRVGPSAQRYWEIFEQLRMELGYADYLGALQRYRTERPGDPKLLAVSHFMINYPFANRLYPESLDAVELCAAAGAGCAILSDGDVVFQPRKVDARACMSTSRARVDLYPQGTGTGRCGSEVSGDTLRDGGRQGADSGGDQKTLGGAGNHGLSAPGTLRARRGGSGAVSQAGYHAANALESCRNTRWKKLWSS
jgi:hypothetical protein